MRKPHPLADPVLFRAARIHLDYSQAELARELGVEANTVARWEQGVYRVNPMAVKSLGMMMKRRRKSVRV